MAAPVRLALVWHMHQPSYRDPATGRFRLPWARLHATKDYADMPAALAAHPAVHVTFTLTPILFEQLDAIARPGAPGASGAGADDPHLEAARRPAESLDEESRRFVLTEFFHVQRARMLEPRERYRELARRAEEEMRGGARLSAEDIRDLQVWFHLAWVDPSYRGADPIRSLWEKGRGFSEAEKSALLDWGVALAGRVAGAYRAARERGQAELATVPYHHPILPLLCDTAAPREVSQTIALPEPRARAAEDARAQLRAARRSHEERFGAAPAGVWPSEGAVNQEALESIAAEGFAWAASDEETLRRALTAAEDPRAADPAAHLRAWNARTDQGSVAMVFRDRRLSDLIGFTYMHWEPKRAAEDFVTRVLETAAAWRGEGPALVTVILDGENCWESYEEDGVPFLDALYRAIGECDAIRAVTVSEALAEAPPSGNLFQVPLASWIRADLAIWVGHEEKNRAWRAVGKAREAIRGAEAHGTDPARLAAARESLYAAEASDWFWWYGDDHRTAHAAIFDGLFRAHVQGVYRALGVNPPTRLDASLRGEEDVAAGASAPIAGSAPIMSPRLEGDGSDESAWRDAVRIDPAATAGTMHRATGIVTDLRYGADEDSLYVRVVLDGAALEASGVSGASLVVAAGDSAGGGREDVDATITLTDAARGTPVWRGAAAGGAAATDADGSPSSDAGAFVRGGVVEARLPFERFAVGAGEALAWRLFLVRAGRVVEAVPRDGALRVERPAARQPATRGPAT